MQERLLRTGFRGQQVSRKIAATGIVLVVTLAAGGTARALTVPFTEHFSTDAAGWFDATGAVPLNWQSSGGPDGSGYATGTFNFANSQEGNGPAVFRAHDEYNSSGGAFVGDWIAAGVTAFEAYIRHNTGVDLPLFVRFAGPANFPGGIGFATTTIPTDTWTLISIPISAASPFIYEGPSSFASVFSNLGHIQIGIEVPASLAGVDQAFSFDIDQARIVPEPASLALLLIAGLGLALRRPC